MREQCFGKVNDGCSILRDGIEMECNECPFWKGITNKRIDDKRTWIRINSLSEEQQDYISGTYYYGLFPWRDALKERK